MVTLLLPIAAFFCLLFVFSFFKPKFAIYTLLIARPIMDHQELYITQKFPGLPFNYLQTIGIAVPAILLFSLILKKLDAAKADVAFFNEKIANYFVLFLIAAFPAVLLADDPTLMAGDWLKYLTLWTMLVYALNFLQTPEDIDQLFFVIILSSIFPLFHFLMDHITGNYLNIRGHSRVLGGYFQQGMASRTLLSFIPAYLFMIFREETPKKKKLILTGMLLFLLLSIYLTYYRTILLALAALLLAFAYFRKYYLTLVLLFMAAVMGILLSPYLMEKVVGQAGTVLLHMDSLFSPRPTIYDHCLAGRFATWRVLIDQYLRHSTLTNIFFGFGFYLPSRTVDVSIAHNQLIQTIFRSGTIAAFFFYYWLYKTFKFSLAKNTTLIANVVTSYLLGLTFATLAGDFFSDARTHWFLAPYLATLIKHSAFTGKEAS